MLAADGRCKTFSNKADGYVRGEGVGVLLIKSLKAALADGDKIHAVVKGTAENHGGRTTSLTAPNPKAQAAVIKAAVKDAGIDFSRVSYIECHGTGTELGDPVEIRGLRTVVKDLMGDEEITHTCKLGSIKSNIGHLEYGAGAVGLVKVILQIKHRRIAQSLFCEELNPYIDLKGTPFQIAQQASDWVIPEGQTRIAGVSSFGFGGVNSHIILEEYREPEDNALMDDSPQLFVLSARSEDVLFEYAKQYRDFIKQVDASPDMLRNIAYTMQVGRAEQAERLVFVASTLEEWAEQLDVYIEDKGKTLGSNVFRGSVYANAADNIELGDTDAGVEYIKQLVAANEAEKLAELWVKGTKVDWFSLHKTPEIEAK
jgi:polyketide synthase PksN